jgi:hypothetical protein
LGNVAAYRIVEYFNQEVQFDLLFYHSLVDEPTKRRNIMHLIDACVRWSAALESVSKEEIELTIRISTCWIAIFGPMQTLVLDEEGGMRGRCALDWAEANNIGLKYKAPRQKAWLVERHNELLRRGLHTTETQMVKEGIVLPFPVILSIVLFAKNSLTVINDSTPYQAVMGRQPSILPPLEGGYNGSLVDDQSRPESDCRGVSRTRELAACNIIESTARMRMERANKHKTRPAVETMEHAAGNLVDIWFDPTTKDVSGWRGPAKIATVNTEEGNITVRYQGMSLDRQNSEVREHIPYLVFFSGLQQDRINHWHAIRDACEQMTSGTSVTLGVIWDQGKQATGWRLTRASQTKEGRQLLESALILANTALHLRSCTTVRYAKGTHQLQAMTGFESSEMWIWHAVAHGGKAIEAPMVFEADPTELGKSCLVKQLIMEQSDVRSGKVRWQEYCVLQFLCIPEQEMIPVMTKIPETRGGGRGSGPFPPNLPRPDQDSKPPSPPPPPDQPPAPMPSRQQVEVPSPRSRTPGSQRSRTEPTRIQITPSSRSRSTPPTSYRRSPEERRNPLSPQPAVDLIRRHLLNHNADSPMTSRGTPSEPPSTVPFEDDRPSSAASTLRYDTPPGSHTPCLPMRDSPASSQSNTESRYDTATSGRSSTGSSSIHEPPHKYQRLDDDEDEALVNWRTELENHDLDEGKDIGGDINGSCSDQVDIIAEMACLTEHPMLLTELPEWNWCGLSQERVVNILHSPSPPTIEIFFEGNAARAHVGAGTFISDDEMLVSTYHTEDDSISVKAVKSNLEMSKEEIRGNYTEVCATKLKELLALYQLGCYKRMSRSKAKNPVDTRWVHTWKLGEDQVRFIKSRITMRGFKDRCEWMETFAGTASRWAQRVVNSCTVQEDDFVLFSLDVGSDFAKGMTFEDLSRLTGEPLRAVEFDLSPEDVKILKQIPGFETFDPATETLTMIKPIYGLKDAPRAWRKKLHLILTEWGMKQLYADAQLYASHHQKRLKCILSTHVDDLKGGATKKTALELIAFVESRVGKCKQQWQDFTHTGIEHRQTEKGIYCHQTGYAATIKTISADLFANHTDEDLADTTLAGLYISVLGGVAWMILTRADLAVYVQALQRRASNPRISDCKKLNLIVRYSKRHKVGIWYEKLIGPVRLVCWSDAAFKAIPEEGSGLALRGCCVLLTTDQPGKPTSPDGRCQLLEYLCKRQRRVVRSTFSAELNALIDALEIAILIQMAFHQINHGCTESATEMAQALEQGVLTPAIDAVIDARAVWDAVAAADACTPLECSLKLHLLSLRDKLTQKILRTLFWADTRDMVADGMTKGGVHRKLLTSVSEAGMHELTQPCRSCVRSAE